MTHIKPIDRKASNAHQFELPLQEVFNFPPSAEELAMWLHYTNQHNFGELESTHPIPQLCIPRGTIE